MSKHPGPKLSIVGSCSDCEHLVERQYAVSGQAILCAHPDVVAAEGGGYGEIGDRSVATPDWCPELGPALERLATEMAR